jgi:hypothetical protein
VSGDLLQDEGLILLCEGLLNNRTLVSLNLAKNELTSYGVEKLKEALK